jgi:GNAT superfamily N-acetyltransferase
VLAGADLADGAYVARDGSWWQGFDGELPQNIEQLTASGHVFAVAGMVVHPHERHLGLAARLQDHLLANNPASLAVTLLDRADDGVLVVFRAWGWQEIGELRRPADQAVLRALVLPLGRSDVRGAGRPGPQLPHPATRLLGRQSLGAQSHTAHEVSRAAARTPAVQPRRSRAGRQRARRTAESTA